MVRIHVLTSKPLKYTKRGTKPQLKLLKLCIFILRSANQNQWFSWTLKPFLVSGLPNIRRSFDIDEDTRPDFCLDL